LGKRFQGFLLAMGGIFVMYKAFQYIQKTIYVDSTSLNFLGTSFKDGRLFADIRLNMKIVNKNPVSLFFEGFEGELLVSGERIASIKTAGKATIQADSTSLLPIDVNADIVEAIDDVANIFSKGYQGVRVKGNLIFQGLMIPVNTAVPIL
jgi:LEA14-like dessication related protein